MANPKSDITTKKQAAKARVTAHLTGELKKKFFDEVERTGTKEVFICSRNNLGALWKA
jgi:hypothetical protein